MDKRANIWKLIGEKSNEIEVVLNVVSAPKYFFRYDASASAFGERI